MSLFKRPKPSDSPAVEAKVRQPVAPTNDPSSAVEKDGIDPANPRILAVGLDDVTREAVAEKGFQVTRLDFGQGFYFDRESGYRPVPECPQFPKDFKEHDIVVIDLNQGYIDAVELDLPTIQENIDIWWYPSSDGWANPAFLYGAEVRKSFNKMLAAGSVFIIFADEYKEQNFHFGRSSFKTLETKNIVKGDNWSFLDSLIHGKHFQIFRDDGKSIKLSAALERDSIFARALQPFLSEVQFHCAFSKGFNANSSWFPLLQNKFDHVVGVALDIDPGMVIILPDFRDKAGVISALLTEVLPEIVPEFFPENVKAGWRTTDTYQLPSILALEKRVDEVNERARLEVDALLQEKERLSQEGAYLFQLVTETGDALVEAVKKAFEVLGFDDVIDADEELKRQRVVRKNREDLQIDIDGSTVIVEVKGISNFPSDDDALAVQKYITLRMREWSRTNIRGLSIINHQRNIAPLLRDSKMPFRQEIIDVAQEQSVGLLTGWDLHRLVRSFLLNRWEHKNISSIFNMDGRISILPTHYKLVGTVERHIKESSIIGVKLIGSIEASDRLGFELPTFFKEHEISTMQLNNASVSAASSGDLVGVNTTLAVEDVKIGMPVYKISAG
jgi:hypothetical protein